MQMLRKFIVFKIINFTFDMCVHIKSETENIKSVLT